MSDYDDWYTHKSEKIEKSRSSDKRYESEQKKDRNDSYSSSRNKSEAAYTASSQDQNNRMIDDVTGIDFTDQTDIPANTVKRRIKIKI